MKNSSIILPAASLLAVASLLAAARPAEAQTQTPDIGPNPRPSLLHCAAHPAPIVTPGEYTRLLSMVYSTDGQAVLLDYNDQTGFTAQRDTNPPSLPEAIARLEVIGDEFTLTLLPMFADRHPDHRVALTNAAQRIRSRLSARVAPSEITETTIRNRLERAAYADITCANIESLIVPWTLNWVGEKMRDAEVAAAVTRISQTEPPFDPNNSSGNFMAKRVQNYAQRLAGKLNSESRTTPQ